MSSNDPDLTPGVAPDVAEVRRRQRSRAVVMAVMLVAFVVLIYAITIVRIGKL